MVIINSKACMDPLAGIGPGSRDKEAKKQGITSAWMGLQYICGTPSFPSGSCLLLSPMLTSLPYLSAGLEMSVLFLLSIVADRIPLIA